MNYERRMLGALPVAALAGALGATLWLGGSSPKVTAQDNISMTQEQRVAVASLEGAFMRIADTVQPATVSIKAQIAAPTRRESPLPDMEGFPFEEFFRRGPGGGGPRSRPGEASGSGVIVRQDGYILTNDHVVAGARDNMVRVTLNDGTTLPGKVFRDQQSDLAVVKVDAAKPLPYVRLADSNRVRVGQWAVAIGSPFGQQNTMTAGIVSALHRKSEIGSGTDGRYYPSLIQTDASINPGNSGGPLLNINGELVGVNVAIYSPTGTSAGIGYAIPSNTAKTVMEQLITRGKVVRGSLGVVPTDILPGLRQRLGTDKGAYVKEVAPRTPAETAGIREDDVITRFNGQEITDENSLREAIGATAPGTRVSITLLRGGRTQTVAATLGSKEDSPEEAAPAAPTRRPANVLGFEPRVLNSEIAQDLKLPAATRGVVVGSVQPGSPASEAGLSQGNVIIGVDGVPVTSAEALNRAISAAKSGDYVTLNVLRFREAGNPSRAAINIQVP